ncbi:MAG: hypothetical protein BGO77_03825 [Caedibacter sp. 37-49]|nr:MAG: hypothetical protein BGO77_03825 [Caedibacter sp. 37-49]
MKKTLYILVGAALILSATTKGFSAPEEAPAKLCPDPKKVLVVQDKAGKDEQFAMETENILWHVYNSQVRATTLNHAHRITHAGKIEITCTYTGLFNGNYTERDPVILKSIKINNKIL